MGPLNIGNLDEFNIYELSELVRAPINPSLPLIEKSMSKDNFSYQKPVIDLDREEMKCQPTVSLEQGLDPKSDSFRKVLALRDQPEA